MMCLSFLQPWILQENGGRQLLLWRKGAPPQMVNTTQVYQLQDDSSQEIRVQLCGDRPRTAEALPGDQGRQRGARAWHGLPALPEITARRPEE